MNKAYAIARAGGPEHLDVKHTQFSNINAAKDVWWIDVPLSRLDDSALEQVDLLLFDDRSSELHHLVVPTEYLRDHLGGLTVRADKECVRLELNANEPHRFQNVKPISSEVGFSQFVTRTL
jgi:hypothetical protein